MLQRKAFTGANTSVGSWPPKCYSDPRTSRQSANCATQSSKSNRDQMIQYVYKYLNTSMFSKTDLKSLVFRFFHISYMFCFNYVSSVSYVSFKIFSFCTTFKCNSTVAPHQGVPSEFRRSDCKPGKDDSFSEKSPNLEIERGILRNE